MLRRYGIIGLWILFMLVPLFSDESDHIAYKFQYFDDNNDANVVTNTALISKGIGEHVRLNLSYLVDGITGASRKDIKGTLDGITAASPTDEQRHEVKGGLTVHFDPGKIFNREKESDDPLFLTVTGINSQETDYTSRTVSVALSQDLFQRNTTIGASYTKSFDDFDPAERFITAIQNDEGYTYFGNGKRQTDKITVSLTQGITITTVASIICGYSFDRGFLAKPYYVYEIDNLFYRENLPSEKRSMTFTGRFNQYIPTKYGTAVHLDYRLYYDAWDLMSHTISLKLYYRFAELFLINPSYRLYMQNSAFFYEDVYTSEDVSGYLTTDFKYRECMTHTLGLKLVYEMKDFFKPDDAPLFSLFPVNIDIAGYYMMRTGPSDADIIASHYNYWTDFYKNFWIQTGITFAF